MPRLDRLRPDLSELMKQDPKAAEKKPLEPAAAPPMTRAEASAAFADRIAGRHEVEAPEGRSRENALAGKGAGVLLEPKSKKKKLVKFEG